MQILIIDDDKRLCDELSRVLLDRGHAVTCARTGREGIETARAMMPDVILLDVVLPELNGFELVQRLARQKETRNIPLIVLSDHMELEIELLTVFDFISKPVDRDRLLLDLELLQSGKRKRSLPLGALNGADYTAFHDFLVARSGLHFERRNIRLLERGILNRMQVLKISSFREYYDYLARYADSRHELQKLLQFLTVGETYFFRYTSQFEALRYHILPELARRGKDRPIRIWSAGCSTGEEPYSIAMTVMDAFPDWRQRDIRVYASDINNRALRVAREGVYGARAVRVTEQQHLESYFQTAGEQFRVRHEVKSLVDFFHLNLQTGDFPSQTLHDLDVIFCRNVLIYFSAGTSRQILDKFAGTLAPGGYLFLGHAETLFQLSSRFERQSQYGAFFYRRRNSERVAERPLRQPRELKPPARPVVAKKREEKPPLIQHAVPPQPLEPHTEELYMKARHLFESEEFGPAASLLDRLLSMEPRHLGALVMRGFISANQERFDEALRMCAEALAVNDLMPDPYFLKGLVHELSGELSEAAAEYGKAILLDREFVMPHYNMAKIHFSLGRVTEALRELRNTLRLLERVGPEQIIPHSGGLSREVFLDLVRTEIERAA